MYHLYLVFKNGLNATYKIPNKYYFKTYGYKVYVFAIKAKRK